MGEIAKLFAMRVAGEASTTRTARAFGNAGCSVVEMLWCRPYKTDNAHLKINWSPFSRHPNLRQLVKRRTDRDDRLQGMMSKDHSVREECEATSDLPGGNAKPLIISYAHHYRTLGRTTSLSFNM